MKRQLKSMLSCVALMVLVTGGATAAANDADVSNWELCGRGTVMLCGRGDPPRAVYDEFVWRAGQPVLNELARSMGQHDFYPFVMSRSALRKLHFVQLVVKQARV